MGATSRQDIITDDGLQAPLMLANNIAVALGQNEKLLTSFRDLNKTLESATSAGKVKKQVEELTLAEKELVKVQNQISVAQAKNTDEYRKEEAQLVKVKKELKEKTALGDRDARSVNAQNAAIKVLEAALNKNRDAYKNLANEEARASKEGQELLNIIQQQDKEVKKLNGDIGDHTDSVGHYELALGKGKAAADAIIPSWAGMARGIMTATKAAIAFIATPLGLFVTGIALALAPLVSYLRNTGDGMDYVEKKTTGLKNGFGALLDAVNETGQSIFDGDTGLGKFAKTMVMSNPVVLSLMGSIKLLRAAFPELAKRFDEAREAGEEFADVMDEINTQREFNAVAFLKEENAIKKLVLQAKNRTATEQERIALVDEALDKESTLSLKRVESAKTELGTVVNLAKSRIKLKEAYENEEEAALALAEAADKSNSELKTQLLDALKALEQARGEDIALVEKLENHRDKLLDDAAAKDEKRKEEALKRQERLNDAIFALDEIRLQREIKAAPDIESRIDKEVELEVLRKNKLLAVDGLLAKEREVIEQKSQDVIKGIRTKGAEDQIKEQEAQIIKTIQGRKDALDAEIAAIQDAAIKAGTKTAEVDKQILEAKKRNAEETIRLSIEQAERILAVEGLSAEERAKIDQELAKLRINLTNTVYSNLTDKEKESIEQTKATLATIKSIYQDFSAAIGDLFGSITDRRLQELDLEQRALEEQRDRDLLNAGDNAKAKEGIEASYQAKLAELDKKKLAAQQRQAKFDKALALLNVGINTGAAIVMTMRNLGLPAALPFMALAAALGAIQAAAIIAKPIPKYAHGVKSHPGGPAIVGDGGGAELIRTGGRAILSPSSATLIDLPAGAEVIPHRETMRQLALANIQPEVLGTREDAGLGVKIIQSLEKSVGKLGEDIRASKVQINHMREGSVLYEARKEGETFTKTVRRMSLGRWIEKE
jgi:hypothetical protein